MHGAPGLRGWKEKKQTQIPYGDDKPRLLRG
jgi:hypothetical protein